MATAHELENYALKASPDFDARWKELTGKANDCFSQQRYCDAAGSYALACTISQSLFHISSMCNGSQADRVVAMVAISAMNAARNFQALKQPANMEEELDNAAMKLVSALQDKKAPPCLRRSCAAQLPHLFGEYKNLLEETNRDLSRFAERFEEARIAALAFWTSQTPKN